MRRRMAEFRFFILIGIVWASVQWLGSPAQAETETETDSEASADAENGQTVVLSAADDNKLFAEYVESVFAVPSESVSVSPSYASRGSTLSGLDRYIYDAVYPQVCSIAAGESSSTILTVEPKADEPFSYIDEYGAEQDAYSLAKVLYALLDDCPYELYWYDKTAGTNSAVNPDGSLVLRMPVSESYSAEHAAKTYVADTEVTGAATHSAENARAIAAEAYSYEEYDALDYYRGEICSLTEYDDAAPGTAYGDPWQLIWVFDGDPSTKVVCEGYAKAFKYLSDLWKVQNPDSEMENYLVEGVLGSSGAHMWNVVHMNNGKNYLADVTNCDVGTNQRRFFLVGASTSETTEYKEEERTVGYTVNGKDGSTLVYRYQRGSQYISLSMYTEDEISITRADYDPDDPTDTFRDVRDPEKYYYNAVYTLTERGIVAGTSRTLFSPDDNVSRAQFVTFLWRADGRTEASSEAPFEDMPSNEDYVKAINWAYEQEIVSGRSATEFAPGEDVTRAEAAAFLWRYKGRPAAEENSEIHFTDVEEGKYYADAVRWGSAAGVIAGYGEQFGPNDTATRGQAVTFLWRMMDED